MNPTTPTSPHLLFRALALLALFALPLYADGSNPKEEVAASDFGFNTDDATEALQKAIDSGAARVVVDKQDSPWIVSKTIRLASNQEIVFEGGVSVMAKKGAFRGGGDCLFVARDVANLTLRGKATLQMRKGDYLKPPYKKAEWRHALSLRGCTNVKVLGLTLKESGGDGVYLGIGPGGTTNKDIVIRDVVCDGNNRQGISVITAENLLIENTVLKNTGGTPPAAGIDFEPNRPGERLVNCIMRNCVSEGNAYAGYDFYLRFMDETSETVTVRIENCVSRNNGGPSAALGMFTRHEGGCLKGKIEFVDCRFEGDEGGGIDIQDNDVDGCRLVFKDCLIRDVGMKEEKKETAPILIRSRTLVPRGFGNISFDDVTVVDSRDRPALDFAAISPTMSLEKVDGTIVRRSKDRTETFELTEALLDEWFPMRKVARNLQSRDWKWTKPAAGGRSTDAASFPRLRGPFRLAAFVEEGDKPAIRFTARQIGQSRVGPYSFVVEGPGGNRVKSYLRKNASGESELTFDVPVTGGLHDQVYAQIERILGSRRRRDRSRVALPRELLAWHDLFADDVVFHGSRRNAVLRRRTCRFRLRTGQGDRAQRERESGQDTRRYLETDGTGGGARDPAGSRRPVATRSAEADHRRTRRCLSCSHRRSSDVGTHPGDAISPRSRRLSGRLIGRLIGRTDQFVLPPVARQSSGIPCAIRPGLIPSPARGAKTGCRS